MSMMEKNKFTFSMMEYPFYRDGMSIEEWKAERQYMADHIADLRAGTYKPLWKQKENLHIEER